MIDPRLHVAERRLAEVARILPVTGGKGGIGKSVTAALLALQLAESGRSVGLLDLDLTGPCAHLILGVETGFPREEFGVEPVEVHGVRFMSVSLFAGEAVAPMRGVDLTHALLELLAITRWGKLDALVIDMPPGLGDVALDALRLIDRAEYVVVANGSRVVLETVRRTLGLLRELDRKVAGVVENMREEVGHDVERMASEFDCPYLGAIPRDSQVEPALGSPERLLATVASAGVREVASRLEL